jgi:hypothetical protein
LASLFCLFYCLSASAQQVTTSQPLRDVRNDSPLIGEALRQVAAAYHVVIGLEATEPPKTEPLLAIRLDQATLEDALDAVTKADPRYSWRRQSDGTVVVFAGRAQFALPDVVMNTFIVNDLTRREILDALDGSQEIGNWMRQNGCVRSEAINIAGRPPRDTQHVTLTSNGKTLRENLSIVARETGTFYWIIGRSITSEGCRIGITLPPPDEVKSRN